MIALAVVLVLLALLALVGMAKFKSVIISEGSGKLGDQIVFAKWKGRNYIRAYVTPANPDTLPQQAQRDKNSKMVVGYQSEVASIADAVTQWNQLALNRAISGFNLFGKYALKIDMQAPPGGGAPYDADITYTVPIDLSQMGMYRSVDGAAVTEVVAKGALLAPADSIFQDPALGAGVYQYFIGPADVFADQTGADKDAVKCANWHKNDGTGTAILCEFTVA